MQPRTRGFTLIELLVVIAIIGVLSSVVLTSLSAAKSKGRDAARLIDMKILQLALSMHYDATGAFPATTSVAVLVTPGYVPQIPTDPLNGARYSYVPYAAAGAPTICSDYHLGTSLETTNHGELSNDRDVSATPSGMVVCTGGPSDFSGADSAKCAATDAGAACFDIRS